MRSATASGEFRELSAFAVSQRDRIPLDGTGELIAKDVPDQLVVSGIVGDGTVVSAQVRGGMTSAGRNSCSRSMDRRAISRLPPQRGHPPNDRN